MPVPGFRELYHLLIGDDSTRPAYEGILLPYQTSALETMSLLRRFGRLDAMAWNRDDDSCSGGNRQCYTCLEHLYAPVR